MFKQSKGYTELQIQFELNTMTLYKPFCDFPFLIGPN
jgi:hypothetical protein